MAIDELLGKGRQQIRHWPGYSAVAPSPQAADRRRMEMRKKHPKGGDMARYTISVNDRPAEVDAAEDTPLLYVLANALGLKGPRLGCGLAQCGSCSVLVNGVETRACVTPISAVQGKSVVTLEGLAASYAREKKLAQVPEMHPLQQAFIDEQAPQCGYCYNGMTVKGAELLARNSDPSEDVIRREMNGHLCRCGTYPRIIKAVQRAARAIRESANRG
jgi:aerobic-type carbon monoxide dehydrogenase small subunit (CoxS/CutS family)